VTYLEGVYWDLDGTIANTELEAHLPAFNLAFNDFGIDWNWDTNKYIQLLRINGGKNRIAYYSKSKNDALSEDLILKIHQKKQLHYLDIIKKNCVLLKTGVFRLIKELHRKKIRQFIVTSSSRNQVDLLVEHLFNGFDPFEFIIASEDVELKKPTNIPMVIDKNIELDCILDSLGDENSVANVIKGPKLKKSYVDYSFLNDYLMTFSNAKN
jgi:phosphoglycolate phosphatase-like HAD superfamily hydrolase